MRVLLGAAVALLLSSPALAAKAPPPCPAGAAGELCRRVAALENASRTASLAEANRNAAVHSLRGRVEALERARGESGQRIAALERAGAERGDRIEALEDYAAGLEGEIAALNDRLARLERLAAEIEGPREAGCGEGRAPVCCAMDEAFCPNVGCADLENDPRNCGGCGRDCRGGACVGGECEAPPPRIRAQIDCTCNDGSQPYVCAETSCAPEERMMFCERHCFDHGGARADVMPACFEDGPRCEAPPPPPPGGDKWMICNCADGSRRELCADSDCSAEDRLRVCEPVCGRAGVSAEFPPACFDGGDRCGAPPPPPPPPGGNLLVCPCADGSRHELCAETDCRAEDRERLCEPVCARNGGPDPERGPACFEGGERCNGPAPVVPDKLLTCFCNDGSRVPQCVVSTCAAEERFAYCDRFCHERGGASREMPASCFEAGPECREM